jgi:catechol 2,3-dioxygenase-like lactoylglutathione lyase family enzyme
MNRFLCAASCAALTLAGAGSWAGDQTIPGIRGIDHIGVTVPDVEQAVTFFKDVVGCQEAFRFGPFMDDKGTFMQDLVNVNPRAVIKQIVMMRCGQGSNIELFQYSAPEQRTEEPKNSDYGGHHIAFYVKDIKAAVDKAKANGLKTFMGPFPIKEGPAAGQSITYVLAPWGMQLELISYPKGMAYEKGAKTRLWAPGR